MKRISYCYIIVGLIIVTLLYIAKSEVEQPISESFVNGQHWTGVCNTKHIDPSSLYTSDLKRSLYGEGRLQDSHYSSESTPKSYNLPCLTEKPYGNANSAYNFWKLSPLIYSTTYQDCDKYACRTETANGFTARPRVEQRIKTESGCTLQAGTKSCDLVNLEYYNSPEQFCRNNPTSFPCPNWWRHDMQVDCRDVTKPHAKNPEQIKDVTLDQYDVNFVSEQTRVEPQVKSQKNDLGYCLETDAECQINDGRGLLMIKRGHEDQATC